MLGPTGDVLDGGHRHSNGHDMNTCAILRLMFFKGVPGVILINTRISRMRWCEHLPKGA